MSRYADPDACPDCRAPIDLDLPACGRCGLPLRGPLAQDLFTTLLHADALLARLRAARTAERPLAPAPVATSLPAPVPVGTATASVEAPAGWVADPYPRPSSPEPAAAASGSGLTGSAVPTILLGLGALCLLIAGSVFLAVAWAVLGVQGLTAVVTAMTAASGLAVVLFRRRGLNVAAESFTVVTLGFLALAVIGVHHSGWLGDYGPRDGGGLAALVGVVVAVAGYLAAEGTGRSGRRSLLSAEWGATAGVHLAVIGTLSISSITPEATLTVAVLLGAAGALGARRRGLRLRTGLLGASAGFWWLILLGAGLVRAVAHAPVDELWGELQVWPLLVAGLIAGAPALVRRLDWLPRVAGAATATTIGVLVLAIPSFPHSPTVTVTTWLALLVVSTLAVQLIRARWRWAVVPAVLLSAMLPGVAVLDLIGNATLRFLPDAVWHLAAFDPLTGRDPEVPAYLLLPSLLALLGAAAVLTVLAGRSIARGPLLVATAALVAGGVVATLVLLQVALVVVVLTLLAIALVVASRALFSEDERWVAATAAVLALTLAGALANTATTALTLALLAGGAAYTVGREHHPITTIVSYLVFPPALAGLVWSVAELVGLDVGQRAYPVLLLLGVLAIVRPVAAGEASAAFAATVTAIAAIGASDDPLLTTSILLTLAGALVTVSALVNPTRRELGWLGGLLLAAATWVWLGQIGVTDPGPYTLPSAVALLAIGLIHLRRHPETRTGTALWPGLGLALVPTLLWALADPLSWRALALGIACLALVIGGALARWSAPLVGGAVVGAVLALRLGSPWLGSIHPWITIAIAGSLLLTLGITWEGRIRDVRRSAAYLRRLR